MKSKTIVLTLILLIIPFFSAFGSLVSTVNIDTPHELDITWYWDETVPSTDTPLLSNWSSTVDLEVHSTNDSDWFVGFLTITGSYEFSYILTDSVTGEETIYIQFLPIWVPTLIMFSTDQYGVLADSYVTTLNSIYHFYFYRSPIFSESVIRLTATVVPIPGGLGLMSLGLILLGIKKLTFCKFNIFLIY
jgi:hypothetical protein